MNTNKIDLIKAEVVRLKSQLLRGACSSQVAMETRCKEEAYNEVLAILDIMQEEPINIWHDASEEPDNKRNIVIWAEGFSNLIAVDEYRPEQKKFYYESGDHYYNVDITRKGLIWAYVDELLNLTKKEEPVSEELEAKIEHISKNQYFDFSDWKAIARYFANWQKEQDKQWLAENHKHIFNNGYEEGFEAGRDDMEEQMMANAIDGTARPDDNEIWCNLASSNLKDGEKVKVIILKED